MQISEMIDEPIELVTFDLYDTLVEADPPRWARFATALGKAGDDVCVAETEYDCELDAVVGPPDLR